MRRAWTAVWAFCVLSAMLLAAVGCDKLPMNGDLEGMWQLTSEEIDGVSYDRKDGRLYASFQLHTAQFDADGRRGVFFALFKRTDGTLLFQTISHGSENEKPEDDNVLATESDLPSLARWGIYELSPSFRIVYLSGRRMTLESDHSRLYFRKL